MLTQPKLVQLFEKYGLREFWLAGHRRVGYPFSVRLGNDFLGEQIIPCFSARFPLTFVRPNDAPARTPQWPQEG